MRPVPDLGVGVGLRVPHYHDILARRPPVDFFEIISENFLGDGGKPGYHLDAVRETYRVVQHGVSLGIGSPDALDADLLRRLRALTRRTGTPWVSDHFCWGRAHGRSLHDLLPLPLTPAMVEHVAARARVLQDWLEVPLALENTSSYLEWADSTMTEWDFIRAVCEEADIGLLFDVNNVYVSAFNHGFDPRAFVRGVPHERIVQIHLAGHQNLGDHIIDTHDGPVIDPVLDLYQETIELAGPVSTLVEWDDHIPPLDDLLVEAARMRAARQAALHAREARRAAGLDPAAAPPRPPLVMVRGPRRAGHGWHQGGPRESAAGEAAE